MKKSDFKDRLIYAMEIENITSMELSKKTNIPKSSISQYRHGYTQPTRNRIHILATALNVSETWLLGFNVGMRSESYSVYSQKLGKELKRLRIGSDLSINHVAKELAIPVEDYAKLENGINHDMLDYDTLKKLSDLFNIDVSHFLDIELSESKEDNILRLNILIDNMNDDEFKRLYDYAKYIVHTK